MGKVFEKLFIEFLIPALLMFFCMVLMYDTLMGNSFDLIKQESLDDLFSENSLLTIAGVLLAYIINTSLSSMLNLFLRILAWGKVREYLLYRKLDVFKTGILKEKNVWCLRYLFHRKEIMEDVYTVIEQKKESLYPVLINKLSKEKVPEQSCKSILDIYDVVRTIVMSSQDSAVIGWIQYHWSQLRLTRSTLVPTFLLIIFVPLTLNDWGIYNSFTVLSGLIICLFIFLLQLGHYYYRERFMIYSMLGYFLTCK